MPVQSLRTHERLRSASCVSSLSLSLLVVLVAGCNGETAFVESSRELRREVRVASADADAVGRPSTATDSGAGLEGPLSRKSTNAGQVRPSLDRGADGVLPQPGQPSAGLPSQANPPDADGNGSGIDEQMRNRPQMPVDPQPPSSVGTTPVNPQPQPPTTGGNMPGPVAQPQPPSAKPTPRPGDWVDVALTQPRAKVDILWVVDSSGSMAWAQNQLKNKFQSFAQKLKETRIDFQVGVTSLDVCQVDSNTGYAVADALCPSVGYIPDGIKVGGKIVGPLRGTLQADPTTKRTILRDTSDFVEAFQRTALLGTKGSAFEHGLWAAKLAVEKALRPGGENQGFVRSDASLSVVVLSDEEDDSVQMWCEDAYGRTSLTADGRKDLNLCKEGGNSPFLDAFGIAPYALMKNSKNAPITTHKFTADHFKSWADAANVKGNGNYRVSAITGLRGGNGNIDCAMTSDGPEESGTNYIKAAQLTGGAVENICASDWSSVLSNIGQNTVELATRVSLPKGKIPYPGTLEVKVDGQALNAMQYLYDASLHAVVFKVPPAMGAEVSVSYRETLVD